MKKQIIIYLFTGMVIAMTGCQIATRSDASIVDVQEAMPLINPRSIGEDTSMNQVANGVNDFAFRLGAALLEEEQENFVFSPYSVWLPLAALLNATDETYQEELLAALGASGIDLADVNQAASRMLFDLTNERDQEAKNPLRIANAIFVDHNMSLRGQFAQDFMDFYRGSVFNVDFTSRDAVDIVNRWANDQTEGRITDIIEEFDPDAVAAIANAIYFSDSWSWEFNINNTIQDIFYGPKEETEAEFMVRRGQNQLYFENDTLQATRLGFQTGGAMYILLPKSGGAVNFLATMTSDTFAYIQDQMDFREGRLLLPRFSIEHTVDNLTGALIALGIPLFDEKTAPLSGGLFYEDDAVWLESATQKAMIEIDEQGATAAAVTVLEVVAESAFKLDPQEPFEMICNTPFVFILTRPTFDGGSQILFTGVVNQP